jgi:uncharacterized protein with GYD domain
VPFYLSQVSYTPEGARGILKEGGTARKDAARQVIESGGGKMLTFYFAFGEDDAYVISEMPSESEMAAVSLAIAASGAVRLKTVALLTPEQVDQARDISVNYRPPGS